MIVNLFSPDESRNALYLSNYATIHLPDEPPRLTRVADIMRSATSVPRVTQTASIFEALEEISRKGMGMTAVLDAEGRAIGIFTDGDLRRLIERKGDVRNLNVTEGMSRNPRHIQAEALAVDAADLGG